MTKHDIRHYRVRARKKGLIAYWEPTTRMKAAGFTCVTLGHDGPDARAEAQRLNAHWDQTRKDVGHVPPRHQKGTLGALFEAYRRTSSWADKAQGTREEWNYAWTFIGPVFGDMLVSDVTFTRCDAFYARLIKAKSLHTAHRVLKILRALLEVAIAEHQIPTNPTLPIRNKAPRGREDIWTADEVTKLIETSWDQEFHGLALIVSLAYDTELQPGDVRNLTLAQRGQDAQGTFFELRRSKTGAKAFATLSERSESLLDAYVVRHRGKVTNNAPFLLNRSGRAYSKDCLTRDFRKIRTQLFPNDARRLMDLRRTGNVEAAIGGALPQDLSAKVGNTIGRSNAIFETYTPTQLAGVRRADEARKRGRKTLKEAVQIEESDKRVGRESDKPVRQLCK